MRIRSALIFLFFVLVASCWSRPSFADGSASVAATYLGTGSRPDYVDVGAIFTATKTGSSSGQCNNAASCIMFWRDDPSDSTRWQNKNYKCSDTYQGLPFLNSDPPEGYYQSWPSTAPVCYYGEAPPPTCDLPKGSTVTLQLHGVQYPETTCYHSCLMNDAGIGFQIADTYYGDFVSTGDICSADVNTNGGSNSEVDPAYANTCSDSINIQGFCYSAKPNDCPKGTVWGEFNGRGVCATQGTDNPNSPTPAPGGSNPGSTGGQTPGANTGTCPADQPGCGTGSGSSAGHCDPSLDAGCIADGGLSAGGKDTGTCPADQPDCGSSSGSAPGKCDPTVDSACSPGSSVSGGTCTKEAIVPPSCSSKDETDCSIVISTWYSQCYAKLTRDTKLDLPDVSHWGDMSKVGLSNCDTISACNASFYDALKTAPVSLAFSNFSTIIPSGGGECPPLSIDLSSMGWGTVSSNIICDSLNGAAGTFLGSLFMLVYLVVAFRIFASS